jgi:hypothetical protein
MNTLESFGIKASIGSLALIAVLSASVEPAHAANAWLEGRAQFEPASVAAPVGNNCVLSDERLARDCLDATGDAQMYTVGLRSEETFAPHPLATCGSHPASRRLGQSCAHSWARFHGLLEPCP